MRRVSVRRLQGRLILRIERYDMSKQDDYNKALEAERASIARAAEEDRQGGVSDQTSRDLQQNNAIANTLFEEMGNDR